MAAPDSALADRRFAIVAGVAAQVALAASTKVRVDLCYSADRKPSHARVTFGDVGGRSLQIDITSGAASDLGAYGHLVTAEIARFRAKDAIEAEPAQ
mgnify:CR=1 FL=1